MKMMERYAVIAFNKIILFMTSENEKNLTSIFCIK